jgi:hypothetical protein
LTRKLGVQLSEAMRLVGMALMESPEWKAKNRAA